MEIGFVIKASALLLSLLPQKYNPLGVIGLIFWDNHCMNKRIKTAAATPNCFGIEATACAYLPNEKVYTSGYQAISLYPFGL